jgi:protein-S-isoprenylcysteine O-methyltransferase Ste14
MNRLFTFPPLYTFGSIILGITSYWLFPHTILIQSPYNLIGIIPIIIGLRVSRNASCLFTKKGTTFYLEKSSELVIETCYKYSRNPMYLGILTLMIGLSIFLGNLTSIISPILFFLTINFICIPSEERLLEKTFGTEYLNYKKKVRRWI